MGKMSKQAALAKGCKVVGSRWVDVDKGDISKPDYRSRLIAKEINTGPEDGLYASTPPLEAIRWLMSETATVEAQAGSGGAYGAAATGRQGTEYQ